MELASEMLLTGIHMFSLFFAKILFFTHFLLPLSLFLSLSLDMQKLSNKNVFSSKMKKRLFMWTDSIKITIRRRNYLFSHWIKGIINIQSDLKISIENRSYLQLQIWRFQLNVPLIVRWPPTAMKKEIETQNKFGRKFGRKF